MPRFFFLLAILFLTLHPQSEAASKILFRSPKEFVPLLEIYSAEGCKDCISTESWVSQLEKHPELWKDFVPVVFPVTLWDRLGWKDSFGSPLADARLMAYRKRYQSLALTLPSVWYAGREIADLDQVFSVRLPPEHPGVLEIKELGKNEFLLVFKPEAGLHFEKIQFHGARLGFHVFSKIYAGENAGQTVIRDFVMTSYRLKSGICDQNGCSTSLQLPEESSSDQSKPSATAAAFWVSSEQDPTPLQSAGGFL